MISTRRFTFGDIIREHRRSYPEGVSLVDSGVRLTWPELDTRSNRLANALSAAGVGAGDRILWLGQNSFRVYELLAAAAKIGAMVCPGYWRWAAPEMAFAVRDLEPRVVVWQQEEIGETIAKARAELGDGGSALWLRHDTDAGECYESFLASGSADDPGVDVDPDSALMVIYTAAITGNQCGSMLSHRNLIAMGANAAWMGDIDNTMSFLNAGPMFHIGNYQVWGMPVFLHGGKNVVVRRVVAEELLPLLAEERCTHAYLMPPTIMQLVELNKHAGHDLSALRATVAPHLWEGMVAEDTSRFSRNGGGIGRVYGQTELTGLPVTGGFGGSGGTGNVGRPGPFAAVRILDGDGRECEVGEAGEICVRGDLVHLGYWNRPEINAERFRFGWWHTTDLGRREADGTLSFLGTTTRMLKSAAENIFPAEVENCLEAHPAVREAAVIGVPNEHWAQDVKAVVVLHGGREAGADELIEHCRERIASYKKPKTVEFVDALPRTSAGTKDYEALDTRFGGGGYPGGETLGAGR
ncbi:AMP-binding protein [Yinghuangia sp. ASG 101]|uniref:AMP-binding protein n=1 Tax=Yinghuangia sp. ASG 101 TaxID=2896848 RepID=UPI001E2BA463|nr:AMP-binding protein [Yinghuangia sp. ASG 101]UGQ11226.1 AMP-binding protein [Yinghuangia sp. ASG 101]